MVAASVPGLLTLTAALATLGWGLRRKRVELAAAFARAKVKARSAYAGGTASIRAMPLPVAIFLGMLAISAALYFHK
jgi:precorrin-4 methylase